MRKVIIYFLLFCLFLSSCEFYEMNKNYNIEMEVQMGTINLVTAPTGGAPLSTTDYNSQNNYIEALILSINQQTLHLTEWDTLTVPALSENVYINHGGALFQVQDSDYVISGSPSFGRDYIKLVRSGDTLAASFVNSATGYSWNYVYNGFYHADGSQLLPYVIIKSFISTYYKHDLTFSVDKFDITADIEVNSNSTITAWDMDADDFKTNSLPSEFVAAHPGLGDQALSIYLKNVEIWIYNDAGDEAISLSITSASGSAGGGYYIGDYLGAGSFTLFRANGGYFDSAGFNDAVMDRGVIVFKFVI